MPTTSAFENLKSIVEYLLKSNSRDQVLSFLCENIDPFGEICAGLTSVIDQSGYIKVESKYGWSNKIPDPPEIHISDDFPRSHCLRTMEILVIDIATDHAKFSKTTAAEILLSEYKTSASIPVNHSVVYGFMFQQDMREFEEFASYLACVRSILSHWEYENINRRNKFPKVINSESRTLTKRQQMIVELIKEGRTNGSIALELGYSESLIRQETIHIYRKLNIDGRRGLINQVEQ